MTDGGASRGAAAHTIAFVAGLHRSGTSALARLLASHPGVSGFSDTGVKEDEGQHLQQVYPSARAYGGAGRFAFEPRAHLTEDSPLVSSSNADRLFEQWSAHWDLRRPVLIEKSPPNLIMTRFLQALYPRARFIVVTRHPIVVSLSTSRWRGGDRTLLPLLDHWLTAHELFRADSAHLAHLHQLTYEDLMADPQATLAKVARFLELEGPIDAASIDPARSDSYTDRWKAMLASTKTRDRALVATVRDRFGERIQSFGYSIDHVERAGLPG